MNKNNLKPNVYSQKRAVFFATDKLFGEWRDTASAWRLWFTGIRQRPLVVSGLLPNPPCSNKGGNHRVEGSKIMWVRKINVGQKGARCHYYATKKRDWMRWSRWSGEGLEDVSFRSFVKNMKDRVTVKAVLFGGFPKMGKQREL